MTILRFCLHSLQDNISINHHHESWAHCLRTPLSRLVTNQKCQAKDQTHCSSSSIRARTTGDDQGGMNCLRDQRSRRVTMFIKLPPLGFQDVALKFRTRSKVFPFYPLKRRQCRLTRQAPCTSVPGHHMTSMSHQALIVRVLLCFAGRG
jgi:hypothetical protein